MNIKEKIINVAFKQVNGYKPITETHDVYSKLPKYQKKLLSEGRPAHLLAHGSMNKFGT